MKNKFKTQNGITLVALVITIIILLILAGVSIAAITRDDGVATQAANASETTKEASNKEFLDLAIQEYKIAKLSGEEITEDSLADIINNSDWGHAEYDAELGQTVVSFNDSDKQYNVSIDGIIVEKTEDLSWYKEEATEFNLTNNKQLVGLSVLVNSGVTFEGKTIKLTNDVDLNNVEWAPIGNKDNRFLGTFDGQNYTIKGLSLNGWNMGLSYGSDRGLGLFGYIEDATIKNVKINNAEIVMEAMIMAPVAAYAYGDCTFDNITVSNAKVANYNYYTGGLVGWASGTQTYSNINIEDSVTVSSLWGTYDCIVGGLIGGTSSSATITVENCNIAAKLDVFNDVCSNYQYYAYRYTGMLIGYTGLTTTKTNADGSTTTVAAAPNVTFSNCTVTYGDWANYTYCEFESAGKPSYAGEGQWKYKRIEPGYSYDGVDINHEHDADETHASVLTVDQLFGGGQGVYGNPSAEGVEVIYNY